MNEKNELLERVISRARSWLEPTYDEDTRKEVQRMLDNPDRAELIDCFY